MSNYSVIRYCSVYDSDLSVILTEESGRSVVFGKNGGGVSVLDSQPDLGESRFLFNCYGVLGSITFLGHRYLIAITEATKCGRLLLEHDVYSIRAQKLVPLFHPVATSHAEKSFIRVFKEFDISNHFYFSYTYNLCNTLQLNLSYRGLLHVDDEGVGHEWLIFDPVLMGQKYCYNYQHKLDLCELNDSAFNLALSVVHGYFSESVLSVSGRAMTFSLISRRSRFYSGTRYRKRGITGGGHVANDVETEQILHDWPVSRSVSSFVLIRGSTPIFWSQDPNESFLMKPPIIYSQNDPTNSSVRTHFRELLSYYGAPLVVLDLLSDNPATEEGLLSQRYKTIVDELNAQLPSSLKMLYFSKNLKSLMERGVARQMLKEVVDVVLSKNRLLYIPKFTGNMPRLAGTLGGPPGGPEIQSGAIRISCLDCLDRTSAFSKHLSLRVFTRQLELIGMNYNPNFFVTGTPRPAGLVSFRHYSFSETFEPWPATAAEPSFGRLSIDGGEMYPAGVSGDYFGFNYVRGTLFEVVKGRYEEMCDVLSMQYAGSKALRKYEGHSRALNISRELFTTVRRRYRSFFEDTRIQEKTNFFLHSALVSHYSRVGVDIEKTDLDDLIHFRPISLQFDTTDSFILPFLVYAFRTRGLKELICLTSRSESRSHNSLESPEGPRLSIAENNDLVDMGKHDGDWLSESMCSIYTQYLDQFCAGEDRGAPCQDADCPIDRQIAEKTTVLRRVLCCYPTIEDEPEPRYTDLNRYRPSSKVIDLVNTELDPAGELSSRTWPRTSTPTSSLRTREAESPTDELSIRDNSRDYVNFLAPKHTADPAHWSLEPRSELESLARFVDVAI